MDKQGSSGVTVTAVRDMSIKKGSAGSHAFECDDGLTYFVKFKDSTMTVVNEHIGYSLASYLELPVPESCRVVVPQELIDASDDLRKRAISAGVHHATRWMPGCVDFRGMAMRDLVLANGNTLPGLVVLDNLLLNMDRNNPGNNLVQTTASGALEFKTVDFSEIMSGRNWTIETLNWARTSLNMMPVFPVVANYVKGLPSFSPWLENVEGVSKGRVDQMLSEIPDSWGVSEPEKEAISNLILTRKTLVRSIIVAHRTRFLYWK